MSKSSEKDLQRLASLVGIDPAKHADWVKRLAHFLGENPGSVHQWVKRGVSKRGLRAIEKKGYPPETWIESKIPPTEPKIRPYTQEEEKMLPHVRGGPARDMDAGSYGAPDLGGFQVVKVYSPGDAVYLRKVEEIFASAEPGAAMALKSNIDQFYDKIQNRKKMDERLDQLAAKVDRIQGSIAEVLNQNRPPEGTEERREGFIKLRDTIKIFEPPGKAEETVRRDDGGPGGEEEP
jgi:hypothetical protein